MRHIVEMCLINRQIISSLRSSNSKYPYRNRPPGSDKSNQSGCSVL